MSEEWLEIGDEELDARKVQRRIEERLSRRKADGMQECPDLDMALGRTGSTVPTGGELSDTLARWLQDCDLVPSRYEIDWRVPIIGPLHAAVRRVINAEIRRFLLPSLIKQSHLNRVVLRLLRELEQENAWLRQQVDRLRRGQERDD